MLKNLKLRDCQAWKDENFPLSTASNEVAKTFDCAIHQYVGWYEDAESGGLTGAFNTLEKLAPDFIMGKVIQLGIPLLSTSICTRKNPDFMEPLNKLHGNAWENLHIQALKQWAKGDMYEAAHTWERLLVDYPTDILALKFAHDTYFYLGRSQDIRDSIARVLPSYKKSSSYYGNIRGMFAFGLEETNEYSRAEKYAMEALDINKNDGWATHAMTHIYEMEGRQEEGQKFLSSTKGDWTVCGFLSCHIFWHWCLQLIEQGRYEDVLNLYDTAMQKSNEAEPTMLDIVDLTSLLYRLQLEGINVGDRWQGVYELCRPHLDDHVLAFNDLHMLFSLCGLKDSAALQGHSESLKDFARQCTSETAKICQRVGITLYDAIAAYDSGDYTRTVELMQPVRGDIISIGGSHAQRDIFNQILIRAALQSSNSEHMKLARALLYERKVLKPNSPLTDRLMSKLLGTHVMNECH